MDNWTGVPEMLRDVSSTALKLAGVLIVLSLMTGDLGSALGFAIGSVLSLWRIVSIANSVGRLIQQNPQVAQTRAASSYIVRYLLVAVVLTMVYFTKVASFYATIIGLFLVQVVIVAKAIQQLLREGGMAYLRQLITRQRRRGGD